MQSTQLPPRSLSGSKKNRSSREVIDNHSKISERENAYLLASKFGDLSQRNQTTYSKQLDSRKSKNQGDNTQYIRNLYKKYLGKQNNASQRKTRTDGKDRQLEKIFSQQLCRQQKLTYGATQSEHKALIRDKQNIHPRKQIDIEKCPHPKLQLFKKFSEQTQNVAAVCKSQLNYQGSKAIQQKNHTILYERISDVCEVVGDRSNSLVLAMNIINRIKRRYQ